MAKKNKSENAVEMVSVLEAAKLREIMHAEQSVRDNAEHRAELEGFPARSPGLGKGY